jgi:prepilin-type N-terminal cleavage/methylation domain-containing protein
MRRVRKGFTLIELLIVVVIIGILAAIAIPKFANTKEKAYLATMKGDLRNLATAQEGYASDNAGAYMPTTAAVTTAAPLSGYAPTTGVTIAVTNAGAGWSATATHAQAPGKTCAIFVNTAAVAPATADGEPKCN